jgi:hypothetical protein
MFFEDYQIKSGDTISGIGSDYGYKLHDWRKIWESPKNAALVRRRGKPEHIQPGDGVHIPIPWHVVSKHLTKKEKGAEMIAERDGELGKQLSWVQTVYRHNQPSGPNPDPFCVDACTPDDDLPFYWTDDEIADDPSLRKKFGDGPWRDPPTEDQGTTKWRAIVSLAVVTEKRVTVWNSLVWGWNLTPAGEVTTVGPRAASPAEVAGHLNLLRKGKSTGAQTFGEAGWTFRSPPAS